MPAVDALDRLESFFARLAEAPAHRALGRAVRPMDFAVALERAIEEQAIRMPDRIVVPNRYLVRCAPADLTALDPAAGTLAQELTAYVARYLQENDLRTAGALAVVIDGDVAVPPGSVRATGVFQPDTERLAPAATTPVLHLQMLDASGRLLSQVEVRDAPLVVGRRSDCDVVLPDISVSRQHCAVSWDPDAASFVIDDLRSTNGTLLNERPVTHAPLADGDVLTVGSYLLTVRLAAG